MPITVIGQSNDFTRYRTGLCSLDSLLTNHRGNVGWPASTITEIYGPPLIGKSTLSVFIAGVLSAQTGGHSLPIMDVEAAYDDDFVASNLSHSGFDGVVNMISVVDRKNKPRTHEDMLEELIHKLSDKDVRVIILDSIGALSPQAEINNPIGSANMGRRGQMMAQASRKMIYELRQAKDPKFVILVNHQYDQLGGIGKGRITPGGTAKSFMSAMRMTMYAKERFATGDMLVALRMDKKRIGGIQKESRGYAYTIPDYGVSPAMTAVFDCVIADLAVRKGSGVWLEDRNYGRLSVMRERVLAGDESWAAPFMEALQRSGFSDQTGEDNDDETEAGETEE